MKALEHTCIEVTQYNNNIGPPRGRVSATVSYRGSEPAIERLIHPPADDHHQLQQTDFDALGSRLARGRPAG